MRHRPIRKNYPNGVFGDIDYLERLERYTTYLENRKKELLEFAEYLQYHGKYQLPEDQVKSFLKYKK